MNLTANWSYPTSIRFGVGRINELSDACNDAGIKNPLFVTDRGLAKLPITHQALNILSEAGLGDSLFSKVDPNPSDQNLQHGLEAYKSGEHDGVIAFGGGSALDLGKVIAFMSGQSRSVWDFEDIGDWWTRADPTGIAPSIAVPTTAGTGSEVGRAGVITNSQSHVKKIIFHPKIMPSAVICDPQLTIGMPSIITVGTGMDAFAHCLEAYSSPFYHPMSQGIAVEGMRLVKENLLKVVENPDDLEGRAHMMSAAAMGATAFSKGLGAVHALSHPVGSLFNTHHGMTNAVVIPPVLRFNQSVIEERIEALARYLNISGGFDGFYDYVIELREKLGVPHKLHNLGVQKSRIDELVALAIEDPSCGGNPVKLTQQNLRELFEQCI